MINQQKIIEYILNEEKSPLVEVNSDYWIVIKSDITRVDKLIEFCTPLYYHVRYFKAQGLCVIPNR